MIYILLPVHNRCNITKEFIDMLKLQTYFNYKLIVIDDGSSDNTDNMVKENLAREKYVILYGDGNLWWGGGLHKGYKYLKSIKGNHDHDYVMTINDDDQIDCNFLESAVALISRYNGRVMIHPIVYEAHDKNQLVQNCNLCLDWDHFTFNNNPEKEPQVIDTEGLMMRYNDFIASRGFHPKMIPHYLSDYEFTYRMYNRGFKIVTNKDYILFRNAQTTNNNSNFSDSDDIRRRYFDNRSPTKISSFLFFILLRAPFRYKCKHGKSRLKSYIKYKMKIIMKVKDI